MSFYVRLKGSSSFSRKIRWKSLYHRVYFDVVVLGCRSHSYRILLLVMLTFLIAVLCIMNSFLITQYNNCFKVVIGEYEEFGSTITDLNDLSVDIAANLQPGLRPAKHRAFYILTITIISIVTIISISNHNNYSAIYHSQKAKIIKQIIY